MQRTAFAEAQQLYVRKASAGYLAFIPPPLPPAITLSTELVARLSDADRALGELAGAGRTLPNPHLLSQALIRREAVLSSRIEGTHATLSELALFELEPSRAHDPDDVREVANYVRAADFVMDPDRHFPLSLPLLKQAHAILMEGARGRHATPGEFRVTQNWIGPSGAVIDNATYVPPSPDELWACLDAFEKYLHAESDLPPLLRIAAIHYQFEAIHPFLDGNGRVGRLLVVMLLIEWGLLPAPLLDLSAYIEPRRDRYYDGLLRVSTQGDWANWFDFFLEAIANQARDAVGRATQIQSLRDHYRDRVATARSSGLLPRLVDELFRLPAMTLGHARDVLGVTHRAATVNVERLVEVGVLSEISRTGKQRFFIATDIINVIEGRPLTDSGQLPT